MTQLEAINMIEAGVLKVRAQRWFDLGAGTGVFTRALATQLDAGGTVYAIDKRNQLSDMNEGVRQARIVSLELDFVHDEIPDETVDGILLANSFHYVREKEALITKLKGNLLPDGRLIVVEYDLTTPNQWVPYPIDFPSLQALMMEVGFSSVTKIKERPSVFNRAMMYSALVM